MLTPSRCPSLPVIAVLTLLTLAVPVQHAAATTIESFSPQGQHLEVRQAVARFSEPMVALGDLRDIAAPFEIDCGEKGKARWIDTRTWAYDFERAVPGGVTCRFRLRDGAADLAGKPLEGQREFTFDTGGPSILSIDPDAGGTISEDQAFLIQLNAPADIESVRAHAWFVVEGLPERVEVDVLGDEETRAFIAALSEWRRPEGPHVVVRARRTFPNEKTVKLMWGAGVRTPSGAAGSSDRALEFRTRKEFDLDVDCGRENARADCNPFSRVTVRFGSSVSWELARQIALVTAAGEERAAKAPSYYDDLTPQALVDSVQFPGPLTPQTRYQVRLPEGFRDDSGRTLPASRVAALEAKTAPYPPLVKFAARFGVLESEAEPALPVTLRNVEAELAGMQTVLSKQEQEGWLSSVKNAYDNLGGTAARISADDPARMLFWLQRLARPQRARSLFDTSPENTVTTPLKLPKPSPGKEMEVVGIPLRERGLYVVELASPRLGASLLGTELPMYVPAAALVTNMAVHFKKGRESSLVWVTRLDDARPVQDARVTLHDCTGKQLADAVTDADGIARVPALPGVDDVTCGDRPGASVSAAPVKDAAGKDFTDEHGEPYNGTLGGVDGGIFVVARTADDMSFAHSSWDDGLEPWRILPHADTYGGGDDLRHTILDRSLLRQGETVHMKHVLRRPVMDGFTIPPTDKRPKQVEIVHEGSEQKVVQELAWDDKGIATTDWQIPAGARLGAYVVRLTGTEGADAWSEWNGTARFRVEQFRIPLMRGTVKMPALPQVATTSVPVDVSVEYLSGGGAAQLPVIVRSELRSGSVDAPEELEGMTFAAGPARTGVQRHEDEYEVDEGEAAPRKLHQERALVLDDHAGGRIDVTDLPVSAELRELVTEIEFRDPNGERQTVAGRTGLWPASRLAGIDVERWLGKDDEVEAKMAVLDTSLRPVAGATVNVEVLHKRSYWTRTRLIGGFYGYEGSTDTRRIGPFCSGTTGPDGTLTCKAKAPLGDDVRGGELILQASTTDDQGRTSVTHTSMWIPGADTSFAVEASDRMELLPERRSYEPGETARIQVRTPFQKATALVVIEREGTGEARVVELSGNDPVIEVPIRSNHSPNIFVSVLLVRGRVGGPQPTALLDLGRPAFRMGIVELTVGQRGHRLDVEVRADKPVYRVREKATVTVQVRRDGGGPAPPGSEIALAAVDEGLLELDDNESWKLLEAMMGKRAYEVETSTVQGQVVGKRHFGRKALPSGGGGGRGSTRELLDTLLLWNARVPLDGSGSATVEVPLNDALTGFRIVAVATGEAGMFGTGATTIRTTQDLMLLPGLPPLVRAGDVFGAELTLRNTTAAAMDVDVSGSTDDGSMSLPPQRVRLEPNASAVAEWQVTAPSQPAQRTFTLTATSGGASDSVRVKQAVVDAHPARTLQATLLHYDTPIVQKVARPADAIAGSGGIEVTAASALAGGMGEVRRWLEKYEHTCLEQKLSVAAGLEDRERWDKVMASLGSYVDADGLLKYFPSMHRGSEVLTAYVLALSAASGFALPDDVRSQMVTGLSGFVEATISRTPVFVTADLPLRKLQAIEALARVGEGRASMLQSITIEPERWPTASLLDWWSILLRIQDVPDRDARLKHAENLLRARLDFGGTLTAFRSGERSNLWWLMRTDDLDDVRLLQIASELDVWRADLPAIARGALGTQQRGRWATTVSNAWGVHAVRAFEKRFPSEPLTGTTTATAADQKAAHSWKGEASASLALAWPEGAQDLRVEHAGGGKPWVTISARAAIPLKEPLSAGYTIRKTVTSLEERAGGLRRGDRLRVRISVEAQAPMTWVVIDDPVPAGSSHLATGLGRGAAVGLSGAPSSEDASLAYPTYVERSHADYRAYFEYLPEGTTTVEYLVRLNQSGRFQLPPTRVEALYAPERFGEIPNAVVEVSP